MPWSRPTSAIASTLSAPVQNRSKGLHIALWVVQTALGLMFAFAGATKTFSAMASLAQQMPWTTQVPEWLVRVIGSAELAGGLGPRLQGAHRGPRLVEKTTP